MRVMIVGDAGDVLAVYTVQRNRDGWWVACESGDDPEECDTIESVVSDDLDVFGRQAEGKT